MDFITSFENYSCPICEPEGIALGFTTWFRVRPESAQALHSQGAGEKAKYEQAIRSEIAKKNYQMTWDTSGTRYPLNTFDPKNVYGKRKTDEAPPLQRDVCVGLIFGLSEHCEDKDVDNMTKLFLDALKGHGGLFHDDSAVVHMDVLKRVLVSSVPTDDNYFVGVRVSLVRTSVKRKLDFTWPSQVAAIVI